MPLRSSQSSQALSREVNSSSHIPFGAHVDPWTIKTVQGDYIQTFKIEGIAHETAHEDEIEVWHEQLALFMRNVNSPHLALWSYIDRRESAEYVEGAFENRYAADFNERYRASVTKRRMFVNELYLAVVYRPEYTVTGRASEKFDPAVRSKVRLTNKPALQRNTAALERIGMLANEVEKNLRRYAPEKLGRYAFDRLTKKEYRGEDFDEAPDHALMFSDALEFYGRLINGHWQRVPLLRAGISETLQTSRLTFGKETLEQRGASEVVYGAMLAWKEYADPSFPGQLNELLRSPFEFTLAQSFVCLDKGAARSALKRQYNRLESTEDDAVSEIEALQGAVDDLSSNRFTIGIHHLALLVRSPDVKALSGIIAEARRALSDSGAVVVREDLGLESAFYSLLAGNFSERTRPSDITSRNFIGFASMHNYPSGKRDGNHWGPALALFKTVSGAPYFFSNHRRDVGHFAVYGSTGAGKTVLVMFLVVMLQKTKATIIFFDKDRGAELIIRRLGGAYNTLKRGAPTGFNPFALEATPANIGHVQTLVRLLLRTPEPFTATENGQLDKGVAGVFTLDAANRRLASLLAYLEPPSANNMAARLLRWVYSDRGMGALAWVLDNETDTLDLNGNCLNGFDITSILDDDEIRTPVLAHLFYRVDLMKDGRRGGVIIDEGWKALDDDYFVSSIADSLKTDRKKDWFLGLITQSPKDSLASRISHTIVEQTPTKIFLPNLQARREDYVDGMGCTMGEFEQIRTLMESGRRFVIKQGQNAVVCELDLGEFADDLALLSGTASTVALLDEIRAKHGDDPEVWEPIFQRERKRL
jgi:type IV secretion system protein VirB4